MRMANTYSICYNHFVFSTKNRRALIDQSIEQRLWAYLGGIARKHGAAALQIGGVETHVHALIGSPPTLAPSRIAQVLKGDSSYWIRREFPSMGSFAWQDGYGVFSVSSSDAGRVIEYIKNQRVHHKNRNFEDEYIALLERHGIEYDERYLFG